VEAEASSVGTASRSGKTQTNIGISSNITVPFEKEISTNTLAAVKTQKKKYCNKAFILCDHFCAYR
jgi:NRPS condensation-like uncharacterized protein